MLDVPGDKVNVQDCAACVTVNVCPPIVIVPLRIVGFGFAATEKPTVEVPLPAVGAPIVIQGDAVAATHAQPAPVVRFNEPVEVPLGTEREDEPSVYTHENIAPTERGDDIVIV
jgi:hypothetical protein